VAAAVGGLTTAVRDGHSGLLVEGHAAEAWAVALGRVVDEPRLRERLSAGAVAHAAGFSWESTVDQVVEVYGRAHDLMAAGAR
jgi:D-inositol-3-phosphate glycosyltransferase